MAEKVTTTKDINAAIRRQLQKSRIVKIGDTEKGGLADQDSIAVGLTGEAEILVAGAAGDYFGAFNHGAIITLTGSAGRYLGDSMSAGGIILKGHAKHGAGVYMTGGAIVIKGSVDGDAGMFNHGGTLIVNGKAGDNVGAYMTAGTIIVTGKAGKNIGQYMTGGEIYCGEAPETKGENVQEVALEKKDTEKLRKYFEHYGILYDDLSVFVKLCARENDPFTLTWGRKGGGGR